MSAEFPQKISKGKVRWLSGELNDWEKEGLIDGQLAAQLRARYAREEGERPIAQMLLACFGALLIGSGIILLLAHNWEQLPRAARAVFSFGLLVMGHLLSVWALYRVRISMVWRESAAVFLGMAIAACIALIGQTYHIPGNLESFLLIWGLLLLPMPFVLCSGFQFILMQAVWAVWAVQVPSAWEPWAIYLAVIVLSYGYILLLSGKGQRLLLHWTMALVLALAVPVLWPVKMDGSWMLVIGGLFTVFHICSGVGTPYGRGWRQLPYATVGSIGFFILVLILTVPGAWSQVRPSGAERHLLILIGVLVAGLTVLRWQRDTLWQIKAAGFWLVALAYLLMLSGMREAGALLMNGFILAWSILLMREGFVVRKLAAFNLGYLQMTLLLIFRFFDEAFGILPRAGVFIALGTAFIWIQFRIGKRLREGGDSDEVRQWSEPRPLPPMLAQGIASFRASGRQLLQLPAVGVVLFAGMALVHYAIPGKMLLDRERTLRQGTSLLFETAPVDPYDPFRGRYVALSFSIDWQTHDRSILQDAIELSHRYPGDKMYALFEADAEGLARLVALRKSPPTDTKNYLQVEVREVYDGSLRVRLPFDRYYMNEAMAPEAERLYLEALRRTQRGEDAEGTPTRSHAEIRVRKGQGVLVGLYLDGVPIEQWVGQKGQ